MGQVEKSARNQRRCAIGEDIADFDTNECHRLIAGEIHRDRCVSKNFKIICVDRPLIGERPRIVFALIGWLPPRQSARARVPGG